MKDFFSWKSFLLTILGGGAVLVFGIPQHPRNQTITGVIYFVACLGEMVLTLTSKDPIASRFFGGGAAALFALAMVAFVMANL